MLATKRLPLMWTLSTFLLCLRQERKLIKDLRQDEIKVFEDNEPQRITNFSHDPDAPLAIALLIDTSTSSRSKFKVEQEAAIDFSQTAIRRKKDSCLLMSFDSTIDLLQPFTDDPDLLTRAIKRLKTGGGNEDVRCDSQGLSRILE